MSPKSDSAGERISATEASRNFSTLLGQVEAGRRFIIQRHGRDVCSVAPLAGSGRRASECLVLLRARLPVRLDRGFSEDLLEILADEPEATAPWDS